MQLTSNFQIKLLLLFTRLYVDWICGCHVMLVNTFVDLLQSYHAVHNIALYFILICFWPDIAEKLLIRYSWY